ncbi:Transglutaminase-like superfamily protein [Pseudooceanicola antarcticus]|uniref:Transglutaminase-like superfamily protein n=1 Tax=Pseudooceanicola antarcticus TaxID=1247613 RepID=A0A285HVH9_9RHOB|nr:transglutaminase-like domain-containing protein [Pseudooceanicola antarcticus]PJE27444.1 hypothetical protein CVM39_12695 [Pseudooceanicola antarcticus]SNY39677.1 Transglutaminase-like superfamily protein [Pseudooceanicola antarcticus]
MSAYHVEIALGTDAPLLLAPAGVGTPHASCQGCEVTGGKVEVLTEANSGQQVLAITPEAPRLTLRYSYSDTPGLYPEALYRPASSRFTRAAEALVAEVADIAGEGSQAEKCLRIARHTAERFTYGHPEERFNDGLDHVPALGCGLAEGSCVDINTYFIAALRSQGIEAGYLVGYFFPAEKGDWCEDAHCWVVTRTEAGVQEWDIAHHLKLGTRKIAPGLNPKPGFRAAVGHSMGLSLPGLGLHDQKLLSEPVAVIGGRMARLEDRSFRLHHPSLLLTEDTA